MASPSPSANSVSVRLGTSETMRRGSRATVRTWPLASVRATEGSSSLLGERRRILPQRLALGTEVLRVHEVEAVVQVHLELAAAVPRADPAHGVGEEVLHLDGRQPHEPLEPDGALPRLLDANGGRELGPHPSELLQELSPRRSIDPAID